MWRKRLLVLCFFVTEYSSYGVDVTFFGGAGEVGGSCALVENVHCKVLVDCGTWYGDGVGPQAEKRNYEFDFSPRVIDAVLLTHAHADHAGRVPQLVRCGFRGTIYMTEPTCKLLEIVWASQAMYDDSYSRNWQWSVRDKQGANRWYKVHWREECKWRRKIARKNLMTYEGKYSGLRKKVSKFSGCRECSEIDVAETMKYVRTIQYGCELSIGGFTVVFRPVEHLPGSAAIYFYDGTTSFVFSGDLGTKRSRLSNPILASSKVDAVFLECTYGEKPKGEMFAVEKEYGRFLSVVASALEQGKLVWIPAFAMDRTQRVLFELFRKEMCPYTLYSLSPSGNAITDLYANNPEWFPKDTIARLKLPVLGMRHQFDPRKDSRKSVVLLTTSGMLDEGCSYEFLKELLLDTNVVVCLVGYQARGTPGRDLKSGTSQIMLKDRTKIPVLSKVEYFDCFSGHGDAQENDKWLGDNVKSKIYLVHGDPSALEERKSGLEKRYGASVVIVKKQERYHLGSNKGQ